MIKSCRTIASTPTHDKRLLVSAFVCSCAGEAWRSVQNGINKITASRHSIKKSIKAMDI